MAHRRASRRNTPFCQRDTHPLHYLRLAAAAARGVHSLRVPGRFRGLRPAGPFNKRGRASDRFRRGERAGPPRTPPSRGWGRGASRCARIPGFFFLFFPLSPPARGPLPGPAPSAPARALPPATVPQAACCPRRSCAAYPTPSRSACSSASSTQLSIVGSAPPLQLGFCPNVGYSAPSQRSSHPPAAWPRLLDPRLRHGPAFWPRPVAG